MLSRLIVNSYRIFVEICLWLSLFFFLIVGWNFQFFWVRKCSQKADKVFFVGFYFRYQRDNCRSHRLVSYSDYFNGPAFDAWRYQVAGEKY